ncbi:MAG TPA: hypothetical protein VGR28_09665 [Candidatus Thermoplasmatota archaeon]|jgi:hypothetical protein|nr:hypothetical protein [Candidatus Thermoplasmatota archaeon]
MFAKTLVLAGSVMALALIPTAAADHIGTQSCSALDGHEDIGILYNPDVYLQCLGVETLPAPLNLHKPAPALPVEIPQLNDAGCIAAEGFEAVCVVYDVASQGLPLSDAGCVAAEGFEAVCVVYDVASQGLPLADAGCVAAEGFEAACTVYDAALSFSWPRAAGAGIAPAAPPCIALYPWSEFCQLPPL